MHDDDIQTILRIGGFFCIEKGVDLYTNSIDHMSKVTEALKLAVRLVWPFGRKCTDSL